MFSLRVSLSRCFHCLLQILCFTMVILGEVDKAFVDVISQSEDGQQNSSLAASIVGRFAGVGAIKQVEGELKEMDNDNCESEDPDQSVDELQQTDEAQHWIGIIHIAASEYYNSHGSKSCSVLDRVKKAMFLGASAIIIITLNQRVLKKLDLIQMFTKPIITVNGTHNDIVSKVMNAIKSGKQKLRARISYNSSLGELKFFSTLTLWATCGRPSGWEGVVCLGNPKKAAAEGVNSHFIGTSGFFASVLFCLVVFKTQLSELLHNYWISKKEEMLRQEAMEAIAKLRIRKIRKSSSHGTTSAAKRQEQEKTEREICAVCLDKFRNNQLVRTLPCDHEFHCKCVDRWLLAKRTCPLCKGNIIESLANLSQVANGNESMDNNRIDTGRLSQGAASQNKHLLVDCRSLHSDVSSKGSNLIRNRR